MGCQSEVYLGDNLTFTICTHDPDTGESADADAAPSYRVYEDETGTPILTGTMALLDDANTVGLYSEQIACTAANGFEHGKTYSVAIRAVVDTHPGAISYAFRVTTDPLGPGATTYTYTLTSSTTGLPIAGADVWVTTDSAGANVVASGETDTFGVVTFLLDAGGYYLWRQCAGYTFTNTQITVA